MADKKEKKKTAKKSRKRTRWEHIPEYQEKAMKMKRIGYKLPPGKSLKSWSDDPESFKYRGKKLQGPKRFDKVFAKNCPSGSSKETTFKYSGRTYTCERYKHKKK